MKGQQLLTEIGSKLNDRQRKDAAQCSRQLECGPVEGIRAFRE
jgi:hypothetical protein